MALTTTIGYFADAAFTTPLTTYATGTDVWLKIVFVESDPAFNFTNAGRDITLAAATNMEFYGAFSTLTPSDKFVTNLGTSTTSHAGDTQTYQVHLINIPATNEDAINDIVRIKVDAVKSSNGIGGLNGNGVTDALIIVDNIAPSAPGIDLVAGDDVVNISEQSAAITGTAEANATVHLTLGGNTYDVTANGSGIWSYTLTGADITAMGEGAETLSATQTDNAGNNSTAGTRGISVDTVAPNAPVIAAAAGDDILLGAEVGTATISGTADIGSTVTLTIGGLDRTVSVDGSGNWSYTVLAADVTNMGQGGETLSAIATDTAGNDSSADMRGITVDTINDAPVVNGETEVLAEGSGTLNGNLSLNDADPDLTYDTLTYSAAVTPAALTLNTDGTYTFDASHGDYNSLAVGATTVETINYIVDDGNGGSAAGVLEITVTGTNDGPTANADTASVGENGNVEIDVLANDTDPDAGDPRFIDDAFVMPGNGFVYPGSGGTLGYAPGGDFESLAVGETATVTASYLMTDGHGGFDSNTVTITINGANDGPVGNDDINAITENGAAVTGNVLGNDADVDNGHVLAVDAGVLTGTYGSLTLNANGSYSYSTGAGAESLAAGVSVTDSFTYYLADEHGASSSATLSIVVTGANDAPLASAITGSATEDGTDILNASFTDVDSGDTHTYGINTSGTIGLVTNNNDGTFGYDANGMFETLNVGATATDTFSYIVTDFNGASHAATATVTITGVNDAPVAGSASGSVSEGGTTTINVTGSFTDVDNASGFTFSADASSAGGGVITDNGNGTFDYDPAGNFDTLSVGQSTTDTFTYVVTDAQGATSSNTVTVTITGENDDPVGVADTGSVTENVSPVAIGNVLANDTEIDQGDTLVVANVLTNGTAAVSQAALETFLGLTAGTLDTGLGAYDTDSGSAAKTTVTVNAGDTLTVTYDFATNETAPDATYNDGAFLSVDGAVFLLADTFSTLTGGAPSGYGLHTGLVTYTHTFASSGTFTVGFGVVDRAADGVDSQLLLSSLDVNGSPLVLTSGIGEQVVSANGSYGSVTIAGDGSYTYTLDARAEVLAQGESVVETFNYALSDGNGGFSNSTLDITVTGTNDAPVIAADTNNSITEGGTPATGDLLANASDVDNGAVLATVAQTTPGTYGTLTLGTDGLYSYALGVGAEALASGETFTETFGYTVTDEFGGTDTATLSIVVTGTNDTPTAAADSNTATEGAGAVTGSVATNDGDVDHGAMLNYTLDAPVSGLTLNGDGSYSFDSNDAAYNHLAQGASTTVTANYTVTDEFGASAASTLSIVVTGTNDGPTAGADSNTAGEGSGAVTGSVATNDSDADDGAVLTYTLDAPVTGLTLNGNGSYSFDSNDAAYNSLSAGQTTTLTANYTVTDEFGATANSALTITVTGTNDAPVANGDSNSVVENDSPTAMGNVLGNDTDVDALDVLTVTNPIVGAVVTSGSGSQSQAALESALGLTAGALDSLGANAFEGKIISIPTFVNAGDTLTVTFNFATSESQNASPFTDFAFLSIDGALVKLADTFTPLVGGSALGLTRSTGLMTYNHTFASSGYFSGAIGVMDAGDATVDSAVLLSSVTLNGNPLSVIQSGSYGVLSINAAGDYNYTLDSRAEVLALGQSVVETFSYSISDGNGGVSTNSVDILVTGTNDGPTAGADTNSAAEDGAPATGSVATNDADIDNFAALTYTLNAPVSGLTLNADGSYSFDPTGQFQSLAAGQTTDVTANYTVTDQHGASAASTLTVTVTGVNDAPTASDIGATVNEDSVGATLTASFTDVDTLDSHTFTMNTTGTVGDVTNNGDGTFTYVASGNFDYLKAGESATDSFTYTVDDGNGGTDTKTANILITGVNDAPTAVADTDTATEDGGIVSGSVSANDLDPDHDESATLSFSLDAPVAGLTLNTDGSYVFNTANSAYQYLPQGATATIVADYTATDENDVSSSSTLTIVITGTNDLPTASAVTGSASEDGPAVTINASIIDVDVGDTYSLSFAGVDGSATDNSNGSFDYNANGAFESLALGQTATDIFTYTVVDGGGASTSASVTVTINGQNDGPTASADVNAATEDGMAVTGTVAGNDGDIDNGAVLTYTLDAPLSGLTLNTDGSYSFDPTGQFQSLAVGQTTTVMANYTVTDEHSATASSTLTITVTGVNDAPVSADVTGGVSENGATTTVSASFTDVDTLDTHTYSMNDSATIGVVTDNGDGTFSYDANGQFETLNVGQTAIDTFTYTVDDGHGGSSASTVSITVTGENDGPTAGADTNSATEGGMAVTGSVSGNDADVDNGAVLSYAEVGSLAGLTLNSDGSYSFDPTNGAYDYLAVGQSTTVTANYLVSDEHGASAASTLSIVVTGINDAPVASGIGGSVMEEGASTTISASFTDADTLDNAHTFTVDTTATLGLVTNNNDGTFGYSANGAFNALLAGQSVTDTFTYTVNDGNGGTSTATATIVVTGENDGPSLDPVSAIAYTDTVYDDTFTTATGTLVGTDPDTGAVLTYGIVGGVDNMDGTFSLTGTYGTLTVNATTGAYSYVPNDPAIEALTANNGESFTVTVSDGTTSASQNLDINLSSSASESPGDDIISGTAGDDAINGLDGDDLIVGGAGNDTLYGGANQDILLGGNDNDLMDGGTGDDTLDGGIGNDSLQGGDGADNLLGKDGNDSLDGGLGADSLSGGLGNDTYYVDDAGDVVTEVGGGGLDEVFASVSFSMPSGVETLTLTGSANINGTGSADANTINGNTGDNILDGGAGADALTGGLGNDTYVVDDIGDVVSEMFGEGTDTVQSSVAYTLTADVENLTLTGLAAVNGTGNSMDNVLVGNAAGNRLDGGLGIDTMSGGLGDDRYYVETLGDTVVELSGAGYDTVNTWINNYTLVSNAERLNLVEYNVADPVPSGAVTGTGNTLDNFIVGNSFDNFLYGMSGVDTLNGVAGNDVLDGGTGADIMNGGLGDDTYYVDNALDNTSEAAGQGTDLVYTSVSISLKSNVENMTLTGSSAINGTGNTLDNILTGNTGANVLTGGTGADTMIGGNGNDKYYVDNAGDITTETLTGGTDDYVYSSINWTMDVNLERLYLLEGSSAATATGNTLANTITGNALANTISGGLGNDTLLGALGNDTYLFTRGDARDTIKENDGTVGNSDAVSFQTGIANDQLWFRQVGSSLLIDVIGTTDRVTIQDWYLGTQYRVEQITTVDGSKTLTDANVQMLVDAMASITMPTTTTLTPAQHTALDAVIAASWS